MSAAKTTVPLRHRVASGVRHLPNWWQFARFAAVGASGYVVNLVVFAAVVDGFGAGHRTGATAAFLVAVANNFWWNRHWTFDAAHGHAGFQAARFLAVSVVAFLFALAILEVLVVGAGVPEVLAQAISIVCATPLNFVGNRIWSFRS